MDSSHRAGCATNPRGTYARRPSAEKLGEKPKALMDRAAYVSYLEGLVERASEAHREAEAAGLGVAQVQGRVETLEEQAQSAARQLETLQEQGRRLEDASRICRLDLEDQVVRLDHSIDARVQRLERSAGDARATAEAEMARLRNEVTLAIQELGQRIDERALVLRQHVDESASAAVRQAQSTCVRLADDALAAAEETRRGLLEHERRVEASFDVFRVDLTAMRAELAGSGGSALGVPKSERDQVQIAKAEAMTAEEFALTIEKKLSARLGQQVLQLSEVVRRVLQAQVSLHQRCNAGVASDLQAHSGGELQPAPPRSTMSSAPVLLGSTSFLATQVSPGTTEPQASAPHDSSADTRRRNAIAELYRELRTLEEEVPGSSVSTMSCSQKRNSCMRVSAFS